MARVPSRPSSLLSNSETDFTPRAGSGRWGSDTANKISGTRYKICLGGKANVGKTALFLRLQGEDFSKDKRTGYINTYEFLDEEDERIEYSIWDTSSFEENTYSNLGDHYRSAHCVILIYDASSLDSLQYLQFEIENIEKNQHAPHAKYILVRNKIDINPSKCVSIDIQNSFISSSCLSSKVHLFHQTSAKTNEGVSELKSKLRTLLQLPEESDGAPLNQFAKVSSTSKLKDLKKKHKLRKCKQM